MVATTMSPLFVGLFALVASSFRTRAALQAEILALRHQLAVFQKNAPRRFRLHRTDRLLWVVLSRFWSGWRHSLQIVQPDTVIRWHRRAFAWYWTRKSRRHPGRPEVAAEIRDLIRRMSQVNPLWGAVLTENSVGSENGQAGDRHRVASPGVSALVEMERSAWPWPPGGISGSSQFHPSNEPRQPALGRASHSWGIAEDCSLLLTIGFGFAMVNYYSNLIPAWGPVSITSPLTNRSFGPTRSHKPNCRPGISEVSDPTHR
jgi:hypothetical protein